MKHHPRLRFVLLAALVISSPSLGQFTEVDSFLGGVDGAVAWGDYDNDGDLDLVIAGSTNIDGGSHCHARIYRNYGGSLVDVYYSLYDSWMGDAAWGDYDRDGYLDLAMCGDTGYGGYNTRILHSNQDGTFTDISAFLTGMTNGELAWGDIDNDGDLDLAYAGYIYGGAEGKIAFNDPNAFHGFSEVDQGMWPIQSSALAWGDYDNDGWTDMVQVGYYNGQPTAKILRNIGAMFSLSAVTSLPGAYYSPSVSWGDYDNDGDLDLALAGASTTSAPYDPVTKIYRNDGGGTFTDIGAGLPGVYQCSLAWGDYDNDGDLDLALSGRSVSSSLTQVYRNDGGNTFTDIQAGFHQFCRCDLAWGDYDNDGDLDLVVTGLAGDYYGSSRLYRNDTTNKNTPPARPTGLKVTHDFLSVTFSWDAATDAETPSAGLTYNLRVGTAPGKDDVFSGMADLSSGFRKIPAMGNCQERLCWRIRGLRPSTSTYYWSVQAIDTAYAGSPWAYEKSSTSIVFAKAAYENARVILGSAIVTASFPDFFYIEEDDRSMGIRVDKSGYTATPGTRVNVDGYVKTNTDGERYIEAITVSPSGTGSVEPLGMTIGNLGGSDSLPPPYMVGKQEGVNGAFGLNNIGLLVRTWGKVTYAGADYFYLDDGSGMDDGSGHTGVKVLATGLTIPSQGNHVQITGISSCFKANPQSTDLYRLIRVRDQADIVVME